VPGTETDAEAAAPEAVTATSTPGGCGSPTTETLDGLTRYREYTCRPSYTWSDPRLNGTVTAGWNNDDYTDAIDLNVGTFAISIKNDQGGWRMRPIFSVQFPGAVEVGAEAWILDGEGAYEGLVAVLVSEGFAPHGFIIDGDIPPPPENASTR